MRLIKLASTCRPVPNATHMVPFDDPALFNATVERFFRTPFVKKDRIKDVMKSFEKMRAFSESTRSEPFVLYARDVYSPQSDTKASSS